MKTHLEVRRYRARKCTAPTCGLRFPVDTGTSLGEQCPRCGVPTRWVDEPYLTQGVQSAQDEPATPQLHVLIDNVRSLRNVGSMFRTADGAGVHQLHLGGITPTPDHPGLAKTALGAESAVPWTHHPDAALAAAELVARGCHLWAVEGGVESVSLFDAELSVPMRGPLVLVLGHEVSGVDPRIVALCERVIHIPMRGTKTSLNVSVAMAITCYTLRFSTSTACASSLGTTSAGNRPSSANHR